MGPTLDTVSREPVIRVRIGRRLTQAVLSAPGGLVLSAEGAEQRLRFRQSATVRVGEDGLVIRGDDGRAFRWDTGSVMAKPIEDGALLFGEQRLPGGLALVRSGARMDAVNHAPIEQYLPGVLERELYPRWEPAAYRAQAIAARSYALWERARAAQRHYDLESTTASQAYAGRSTRPRAIQAVQDTRGQVLAYRGRVLPAFYSSSTGGTGQDAVYAFPDRVEDLPPLRGVRRGKWGDISPMWRWATIVRNRATLSARVRAWGAATESPAAQLGTIASIRVVERNNAGRPTVYEVKDTRRRAVRLPCEQLRFACNYAGGEQPSLERAQVLPSSHFSVRVGRNDVRFENGRGFGHGVGLGQWGAQHLAQSGKSHLEILAFYYRGARVERAYP